MLHDRNIVNYFQAIHSLDAKEILKEVLTLLPEPQEVTGENYKVRLLHLYFGLLHKIISL